MPEPATGKKKNEKSKKDEGGKTDGKEDKDEGDELKSQLESAIIREKPNFHWDDVAGLEGAKAALREAVILPVKFPKMFEDSGIKPWRGILM